MQNNSDNPYRGKRALLLTRVSTPKQIEMYGHTWQEMQIRKLLIEPLGLQLDEERHIIRDTYSGLEYRYREALDTILAMAERGEIDVVCMEVLDRGLGRKGLPREMFRLQLRELGVRILTTDPDEHADDDSLIGEMIRLIKGYKAEEEINDLVRRTMGGKRAKAEGRERDGAIGQQKIVGNGSRLYGYKFVLDENGRTAGIELNYEVVHIEETGEEWTEVKVVRFIFESSAAGMSIRKIAELLNEKGIPPATITKKIKIKRRTGVPLWQPSVISKILRHPAYWGEYPQFRTVTGERKPGRKMKPRLPAPQENQVIIPVPAIVSKELAEIEQCKKTLNRLAGIRKKQTSLRKNLSDLMQEGKLDKGTREFLSGELQLLAKQEETCLTELASEQALQDKYNLLQERIAEFHQRCIEWRENIDDPESIPSYQFMRDACEFFGITAIVYKFGHDPRFEIQVSPPSIMSLISSALC